MTTILVWPCAQAGAEFPDTGSPAMRMIHVGAKEGVPGRQPVARTGQRKAEPSGA